MFVTEWVVPNERISSIISVLEFYTDENKTPEIADYGQQQKAAVSRDPAAFLFQQSMLNIGNGRVLGD